MDTEESERLLHYQHHSFDETLALQRKTLGWKKLFVPIARPFIRHRLLAMSPYYRRKPARSVQPPQANQI
jgi:hypothetical protein